MDEIREKLNKIDHECLDSGKHFYDFRSLYEAVSPTLSAKDRMNMKKVIDTGDKVMIANAIEPMLQQESLNENSEDYDAYSDPEAWEEIDYKSVKDSDGWLTEYTLYYNAVTDEYVCVFGDRDLYRPEDMSWDAGPFETEQEAMEWFDSYEGFEDDDFDESLKESKSSPEFLSDLSKGDKVYVLGSGLCTITKKRGNKVTLLPDKKSTNTGLGLGEITYSSNKKIGVGKDGNYVLQESLHEELNEIEEKCAQKFDELKKILMDGVSKESTCEEIGCADRVKKAFQNVGGRVRIGETSPTYVQYDGVVYDAEDSDGRKYTVGGSVSGKGYILGDLNRLAEDLTMAYNVKLGGEREYTPGFIKRITGVTESLKESVQKWTATDIVRDLYNKYPKVEFLDERDISDDKVALFFKFGGDVTGLEDLVKSYGCDYRISNGKLRIIADEDEYYMDESYSDILGGAGEAAGVALGALEPTPFGEVIGSKVGGAAGRAIGGVMDAIHNHKQNKVARNESLTEDSDKYYVSASYGKNFTGLEDNLMTDDYEECKDFLWDKLNQGLYCQFKNTETGEEIRLDPDKIDDYYYEGEFDFGYNPLNESKGRKLMKKRITEGVNDFQHVDEMKRALQNLAKAWETITDIWEFNATVSNEEQDLYSDAFELVNKENGEFPVFFTKSAGELGIDFWAKDMIWAIDEILKKNSANESLKEAVDESEAWPYEEVLYHLKKRSNNFTTDGSIKTEYQTEKDYAKEILKKYFKYVEVSDGRTYKGQDMIYNISWATPIKKSMGESKRRKR